MRVVVQRVRSARVRTDEEGTVGQIQEGLLALCGFLESDNEKVIDWVVNKLATLRIFNDENGKLNRSVTDVGGAVLVISNFTLYGNCAHAARPDFSRAAPGAISRPLYDMFVERLAKRVPVQTGRFGEHMELNLDVNGPITVVIDKENKDS